MNDRVATLTVPAESRASDRLFAQLLRALASSGTEGGVAAERRVGSTSLRLVVRPPSLLESVEANLRTSRSSLLGDDARSVDPPPGWEVGYGILTVPATVGVRPEQSRRDPRAPRPLANPMARSGRWIDARTYWVPRSGGGLWVARAYRVARPPGGASQDRMAEAGTLLAQHWSVVLGRTCVPRELSHRSAHRAWQAHSSDAASKDAWTAVDVERGVVAVDLPRPSLSVATLAAEPGHLSVFGTSGAGKTSFLAELAAEAIRRGEAVVALDLHGDLAPGIVDRLTPLQRERVIAIDVTDHPIPGVNVLRASSPEEGDRSVAHLVAALKRLSPDGQEIYWGFRLERIFDSFVRLVQEEGGTLVDLASALESTERREALRAQTRHRELARFLDELGPILRRQPDFLWPAAARVSKVVLVPALAELLAPANGLEPAWEAGVRSGRSLVLRLPFAEIGSEAAALASTLLLARIYLVRAASATEGTEARPVLLLFDEAHAFAPRLLSEIVSEGRKFGIRAVVSTQYPQRLSSEVEAAIRGAASSHVCFRVPPGSVRPTAEWLGIDRSTAPEQLGALPTGTGLVVGRRVESLVVPTPPSGSTPGAWKACVERTRREVGLEDPGESTLAGRSVAEEATEALLLAVLLGQERGAPLSEREVVVAAHASIGPTHDAARLADRWSGLVRSRWVLPSGTGWTLGSAGAEALGVGRATGATRETAEHRALLLEAFRLFARRGCRLEILRQGRFDTTLPDARLELLRTPHDPQEPEELARQIDRARAGWAWRFFHGRNVHVEAEVSGAMRAERIRNGCRKAERRGAFALFLVADALRARRVRSVLHSLGLGVDRAQVWTLRGAISARPPPGETV